MSRIRTFIVAMLIGLVIGAALAKLIEAKLKQGNAPDSPTPKDEPPTA